MKTIFRIFLSDIKKIRTNLMAFAVMIGICILPAVCAVQHCGKLGSYSNTGNIKIAVANCDKGTKIASKEINLGNQIVDNLKKNTQMCWTFVDKQQAENGVVTGEYYASVVIPENFSESFTSILSGKLTRPQITYTLNEKKNAIAPKITDKGAEAIKNQVNEPTHDYHRACRNIELHLRAGQQEIHRDNRQYKISHRRRYRQSFRFPELNFADKHNA
ncbi:MAG: YhgE/Pip domain-containing protein [[Eubacterium] siraeum]